MLVTENYFMLMGVLLARAWGEKVTDSFQHEKDFGELRLAESLPEDERLREYSLLANWWQNFRVNSRVDHRVNLGVENPVENQKPVWEQ